jgi:hypothetical protein
VRGEGEGEKGSKERGMTCACLDACIVWALFIFYVPPCIFAVIVLRCLASSALERGEKALSNELLTMENDEGETEKRRKQAFFSIADDSCARRSVKGKM